MPLTVLVAVVALIAVLTAVLLAALTRRVADRQRAFADVLDAADRLEARLRHARAEIEAIVGDGGDPVRDAMQEMLRQRLWLQQHGEAASLGQLAAVRDSILDARLRIDQQLAQIERARALIH